MENSRFLSVAILALVFVCTALQAYAQQTIQSGSGSVFMEEVPTPKQKSPSLQDRQGQNLPVDLRNLGVPVNANGHIVPLIQSDGGAVMPFGTDLEVSRSPTVIYAPTYYLNAFGQKVDAFGNLLPAGRYLPYTPYLVSPGAGASFSNRPGGDSTGMSYQGSNVGVGYGSALGGRFSTGRASGGLLLPGSTRYDYKGTIRPLFPSEP